MKFDRVEAPPITPGDVLRENVLAGRAISQDRLAIALGVSRHSVSEIVNGKRGITADMALRLAKVLSTDPDFWLNLQRDVDLYEARRKLGDLLGNLEVLREPADVPG